MIPGPAGDGIWILDLARGVRTRLAHGGLAYTVSIWSRDGSRILFGAQTRGTMDLYLRPTHGSGQDEPVLVDATDKELFDWSRDGRYVAYWPIGAGGATSEIWIYSLEKKVSDALVSGDATYEAARFSTDGRWIAYVSDESGREEVFVQALAEETGLKGGARWQLSTAGGKDPHWRDDGREVVYTDLDQRVMAVAVEEREGRLLLGTPRELFTIEDTIVTADATGDHQRFLVATREREAGEPLHVILDWRADLR